MAGDGSRPAWTTGPGSAFFWAPRSEDVLLLEACQSCDYLIHPPSGYCPACGGRDVAPRAVSGDARLYSYSLLPEEGGNDRVVAIVELTDQPGLRLMSNVVGVAPDSLKVGMELRVAFRQHGRLRVPVFEAAFEAES